MVFKEKKSKSHPMMLNDEKKNLNFLLNVIK